MSSQISVVICAYTDKRWNELAAAVASVHSQIVSPREVIVVIDHNHDLFLRAQEHLSGAIVIENGGDKGLSGARNTGWSLAQGEIVAFLDDDAVAEPVWLENLAAGYTDAHIVGVGGKIVPLWENPQPFWFPEEFNWVIGSTYRGMPTSNARIRNVIGANMSMRKDILAATGGFRESFGCDKDANAPQGKSKWLNHYAGDEETEFCIRVSEQIPGSIWLYAASAGVQHRVSAERTRWKYFMWRCYDEGLGKASLVKLHDTSSGLSSERTYTLKVLPAGVGRGLVDTFFRFKPSGIFRSGAIVLGLVATTTGYIVGNIASRITDRRTSSQVRVDHSRTVEALPPM